MLNRDWGPAYAPSGLTGDVSLFQPEGQVGKLESLVVLQSVTIASGGTRGSAVITPRLRIAGVSSLVNNEVVAVSVKVNNEAVLSETVTLTKPDNSPSRYSVLELSKITLQVVELWFPRGYGKPTLYTIDVEYCAVASSSKCQVLSKRIGFRTVELVQEPLDVTAEVTVGAEKSTPSHTFQSRSQNAAHPSLTLVNPPPASFYIKVNGIAVFAKGANFIPIDVFTSRVTDSDRKYVLEAAAAAHMNMVREGSVVVNLHAFGDN